jgi:Ala-tRNA(Pro) deacylase
MDIYKYLADLGIRYQRYEHPPVFTCEEADRLVPPMEAARTKNVFLRDRKGTRHFLVVVSYEKSVDLKALAPLLAVDKLSLRSEERLQKHLGVTPGSVTILGLACDTEHRVELVLDEDIAAASALRCHPLVNTATLALDRSELDRFLAATGHHPRVLAIPGRPRGG